MTRVLVADDSETILLLLRTRLEMEGYEVITASDGQEVLEVMSVSAPGQAPDVILLDAMMPRKSGLDALQELRTGGVETPILIVSAHREEEALGRAEDMGADGLIPKPIDFEDLLGRIAELTSASPRP
jgi:two-component system response regulator CpxR